MSLSRLVNGSSWNAETVNGKVEIHAKQIRFLQNSGLWQPIDCNLSVSGADHQATSSPLEALFPDYSDKAAILRVANRFDVFTKQNFDAPPLSVAVKPLNSAHVLGTANGVSKVYLNAYPTLNADLVWKLNHARSVRAEKWVRFNSAPIADFTLSFYLEFVRGGATVTPEISPAILPNGKTRLQFRDECKTLLDSGGTLYDDGGFYIRAWDETSKLGTGIRPGILTNGNGTRVPIPMSIRKFNGGYILTKHFTTADFAGMSYPCLTDATFTFYPDPNVEVTTVDGLVARTGVNEAFATIRGGAGTTASDTIASGNYPSLAASATTDQYATLVRDIFLFDTTSIAGYTYNSATLDIYVSGKADLLTRSVGLTTSNPASNTALVTGDYAVANFGSIRLASDIAISAITTSAYNSWTLNASGLALLGAIVKLGLRIDSDIDNSAPTWISGASSYIQVRFADWTGTDFDPKLVVDANAPSSRGRMIFMFEDL